ncbi:MAG: FtsW/RodA/SpoVE family cell cycle protein, partial [Treponema sp.]|nr:FtsW/RodA/SpoVE family cell cycle protein [Treponema sp.]
GYQIFTSLRAINSGGFWGKGLGQGTWKISGIPEVHSDFIFSSFAEEMGLLGVIFFIALFIVFTMRGYRGAMRNEDSFSRILGFGMVTMIVSQALVNLAVAAGALPVTGLPLPFFSAGGTYLTMVLIMAGIIANVSRENVSHIHRGE